jgi:ribosomal protein L33
MVLNIVIKCTKCLDKYYVHAYETWKMGLSKFCNLINYGEGYDNFMGWNVTDSDIYIKK